MSTLPLNNVAQLRGFLTAAMPLLGSAQVRFHAPSGLLVFSGVTDSVYVQIAHEGLVPSYEPAAEVFGVDLSSIVGSLKTFKQGDRVSFSSKRGHVVLLTESMVKSDKMLQNVDFPKLPLHSTLPVGETPPMWNQFSTLTLNALVRSHLNSHANASFYLKTEKRKDAEGFQSKLTVVSYSDPEGKWGSRMVTHVVSCNSIKRDRAPTHLYLGTFKLAHLRQLLRFGINSSKNISFFLEDRSLVLRIRNKQLNATNWEVILRTRLNTGLPQAPLDGSVSPSKKQRVAEEELDDPWLGRIWCQPLDDLWLPDHDMHPLHPNQEENKAVEELHRTSCQHLWCQESFLWRISDGLVREKAEWLETLALMKKEVGDVGRHVNSGRWDVSNICGNRYGY